MYRESTNRDKIPSFSPSFLPSFLLAMYDPSIGLVLLIWLTQIREMNTKSFK